MAMTLIKVLNESTQSSIVEMFFFGLALSLCNRTSSTVGAGAPRRAGRSSSSSIYSPRQIFSANLDGRGGETGPTATAFFDTGVSRSETIGVSSENWSVLAWLPLLLVSMPASDRGLGSVASPPPPVASPMIVLSIYLAPLYAPKIMCYFKLVLTVTRASYPTIPVANNYRDNPYSRTHSC